MLKRWDKISESTKNKIVLSNKVNGALIIVFVTVFFIDIALTIFSDAEFSADFFISIFVIILCSLNLLLNYYGYFKLTRVLLLFLLPASLIFLIPLTGNVLNLHYLWLPYLPVVSSVLPYYFFSDKSEKKWLFITLGFYFLLLLSTDNILTCFADKNLLILPIIHENAIYYKTSEMLIFLVINITLYYVFEVSRKYEHSLIRAKELLNKKNVELKKKNAELNQINATKNTFFHIIGHDLRAPVAQIIQIAELFEESYNNLSEADHKHLIKTLKESSSTGYRLLDDLFNWAQAQTGQIAFAPVALNLHCLVEENMLLLQENARYKEIQIINNVEKNCSVFADANMLNTILRNLISNAIKFTYHQGKIEIDDHVKSDGVEITIQDNGVGIPTEDLDRLFEIDKELSARGTDNEKGTGIGLILCKEFIDYHKGKIRVESEPGKGSRFIFFLPENGSKNASKL